MLQTFLAAILVVGIFTGEGDLLLIDISFTKQRIFVRTNRVLVQSALKMQDISVSYCIYSCFLW